ncbi:MAG: sensor histidine kinase [Candidatus Geothermincolia bacterium]
MEQIDLKKNLAEEWRASLRRVRWIFWPVCVAAEVLFLAVQVIYLVTNGITAVRFVINCVIFNIILASLLLLVYVGMKRLLGRIYDTENKMLTIADISTDAVYTQDTEFGITSWSMGAERIFGYAQEEAIGSSTAIMLPEEIPEVDGGMAATLMLEGIITQHRTIRRRKNGELFPAEVSVSLLRDPAGQPTGGLTVLRDITRQVEMEDELLRANAELKGYAHVVSHDLKAPLATIKLAAQTLDVLIRNPVTAESQGQIDQVRDTLDRCIEQSASLIGDLLALAEAGQKPEVVSPVDVGAVIAGVLDEIAGYLHEAGATVRVDEDMGSLNANTTHVHQVFANLISNAIRHNDSSAPLVEVINMGRVGDAQRYMVRDNGSGVPESELVNIFVPFYKGESGDTGIGLSTVAKIVGVYDGEIRVFNDGGACFEFVLHDMGGT